MYDTIQSSRVFEFRHFTFRPIDRLQLSKLSLVLRPTTLKIRGRSFEARHFSATSSSDAFNPHLATSSAQAKEANTLTRRHRDHVLRDIRLRAGRFAAEKSSKLRTITPEKPRCGSSVVTNIRTRIFTARLGSIVSFGWEGAGSGSPWRRCGLGE